MSRANKSRISGNRPSVADDLKDCPVKQDGEQFVSVGKMLWEFVYRRVKQQTSDELRKRHNPEITANSTRFFHNTTGQGRSLPDRTFSSLYTYSQGFVKFGNRSLSSGREIMNSFYITETFEIHTCCIIFSK